MYNVLNLFRRPWCTSMWGGVGGLNTFYKKKMYFIFIEKGSDADFTNIYDRS